MQPLVIDLKGKKVTIAGGGTIALRKAMVLGDENPILTFIAPAFSDGVLEYARNNKCLLIEREAEGEDFADCFLAIIATNDRQANSLLSNVIPHNILCCVVDEHNEGNALFPATVKRGHLQIAVSSSGASPKLTRKLKKELESHYDESWIEYSIFLADVRNAMKEKDILFQQKQEILEMILDDSFRLDSRNRKRILESLDSIHHFNGLAICTEKGTIVSNDIGDDSTGLMERIR
ncbi:bifunctional precorrin-2 dehydrogenase/sirohydrochlorin ferrochelatase [Bacillus sp. 1P06AnD]|uniref:precorrin-2 dehydrogenase/sirohydrochlorin ferrochelatase family protein n=1 Tax=Bacillus sp. 1P06AnD TaxID=3132208 RepID=UPI00399EFC9F